MTTTTWKIDPRSVAMFGDPNHDAAWLKQELEARGFGQVSYTGLYVSRATSELIRLGNPGHWKYISDDRDGRSDTMGVRLRAVKKNGVDAASLLAWLDSPERAKMRQKKARALLKMGLRLLAELEIFETRCAWDNETRSYTAHGYFWGQYERSGKSPVGVLIEGERIKLVSQPATIWTTRAEAEAARPRIEEWIRSRGDSDTNPWQP